MKRKLAAHVIDLIHHACLHSFWRKIALTQFLRLHDVSKTHLSGWLTEETKRDYLERLFYDLINMKDNEGHSIILEIGRSLSKVTSFSDLENWEDSKQKIDKARRAIHRLKPEIDKIDNQLNDEKEKNEWRKRTEKEREYIQQEKRSLMKLQEDLNSLFLCLGEQKAGYDFEKWWYELVIFNEIEARCPYKDSQGRQIDGSLTIDGTTFLIEAKFTRDPVDNDAIDSFCGKLSKKADNTMGLMVSISGYTDGAIQNASKDRTTMLLLDHSHIYNLILSERMSLKEIIQRIYRHAGQTGESFLSVNKF